MRSAIILATCLLVACSPQGEDGGDGAAYSPSELQQNVDRSFSDIAIGTPLAELEEQVAPTITDRCEQWGECEWRGENGVRHHFQGEGANEAKLAVKTVMAEDIDGGSISALGIAMARDRDEVLAAAGAFLGNAEFECIQGDRIESCNLTLQPGWITIDFDEYGRLLRVRFDGYPLA